MSAGAGTIVAFQTCATSPAPARTVHNQFLLRAPTREAYTPLRVWFPKGNVGSSPTGGIVVPVAEWQTRQKIDVQGFSDLRGAAIIFRRALTQRAYTLSRQVVGAQPRIALQAGDLIAGTRKPAQLARRVLS